MYLCSIQTCMPACMLSHFSQVWLFVILWTVACLAPLSMGFSRQKGLGGSSDGKESACNVGDPGSIPGLERFPWRREWQPTPVFLPGESYGRRSLVGYGPWSRRESDMTKWRIAWLSGSFTWEIQLWNHASKKLSLVAGLVNVCLDYLVVPLLPRTYVKYLTTFPDACIPWDLGSDAGS